MRPSRHKSKHNSLDSHVYTTPTYSRSASAYHVYHWRLRPLGPLEEVPNRGDLWRLRVHAGWEGCLLVYLLPDIRLHHLLPSPIPIAKCPLRRPLRVVANPHHQRQQQCLCFPYGCRPHGTAHTASRKLRGACALTICVAEKSCVPRRYASGWATLRNDPRFVGLRGTRDSPDCAGRLIASWSTIFHQYPRGYDGLSRTSLSRSTYPRRSHSFLDSRQRIGSRSQLELHSTQPT